VRGHFEPDDQAYVNKDELSAWGAKDPIRRETERLLNIGALSLDDVDAMQVRVEATVARAVEFAAGSPFPAASELTTHVYA
jgi:pyruvate dehydrogenase E1 component alpha subunit